jgi:ligand-binding sensor domain-containing protein
MGTNLLAGTSTGAFLSTDNGDRWSELSSGLNAYVRCFVVAPTGTGGTNLFAGTDGSGVFLSSDNGLSWSQVNSGLTNPYVLSLAADTNVAGVANLFAGTSGGGVFLSTDNGASWTPVNSGLTKTTVWSFAIYHNDVVGTNPFAGTVGGGVFVTANNGASWTQLGFGLTSVDIRAFAVSGSTLYAGTRGNGVWRRPLAEMITSVSMPPRELPMEFSLSQNYPNPFNPRTSFEFRVSSSEFVTIRVFDLLGTEVSTLVNDIRPAGLHKLSWDASGLPSGVYFYRLQAGHSSATKKMMLLR